MDTTKKISFGFNKLNRKTNILLNKEPVKPENTKVQLIEYLEEQSIKVIGDEHNIPVGPLIIPMKAPNKNLINLVDIVRNDFKDTIDDNQVKNVDNVDTKDEKTLTLDELAAKELINGTSNNNSKTDVTKVIEVPASDKVTFDGEKESSLDDYESVPVDQFGKALLRGMGWKDGQGIGKNQQLVKMAQPVIRPKGMGLGADSLTKKSSDTPAAVDRNGKVLTCVKGAHVKIIAGYHKGYYGQIQGFDDESGRFIIKLTLSNINVSLNEFLVTPVTKEDYNKNSKVLNNAKYEEYLKQKELSKTTKQRVKTEPEDRSDSEERIGKVRIKKEQSSDEESSAKHVEVKQEPDRDERKHKLASGSSQGAYKHRDSKHKSCHDVDSKHKSQERSKVHTTKDRKKKDRHSDSQSEVEEPRRTSKYDSADEHSTKKCSRRADAKKGKKPSRKSDSEQDRRGHSNKRYSDSESEERSRVKKRNSDGDNLKYQHKSRKHSRNKRYDSGESDSADKYDRRGNKQDKYRDRSKHSSRDNRK